MTTRTTCTSTSTSPWPGCSWPRTRGYRAGQRPRPAGRRLRLTAVHALLGRLHDAAADAGRDGSLLEIRMLQALAHARRRRPRHGARVSWARH